MGGTIVGTPSESHPDRPDGIAGVILWTSADRFDGMRAFYRDVVGLRPRSDRAGFVNFDLAGARLTISVHADVVGPARDPLRVMVNLRTPDIGRAVDRLRRAGVRIIRPPEPEPWGGVVATFEDPDGNVLQYMQLPEYTPS